MRSARVPPVPGGNKLVATVATPVIVVVVGALGMTESMTAVSEAPASVVPFTKNTGEGTVVGREVPLGMVMSWLVAKIAVVDAGTVLSPNRVPAGIRMSAVVGVGVPLTVMLIEAVVVPPLVVTASQLTRWMIR